MMFPDDWGAFNQNARKRPKSFMERVDACESEPVTFVSDLQHSIERSLNQAYPNVPEGELDVDHILSHVPYRDLLENLFGDAPAPDLPLITKSFEESFMRQPGPGERPCAMGEMCECRRVTLYYALRRACSTISRSLSV
jgi:hypothetical protein